jgi:hypothetical protein
MLDPIRLLEQLTLDELQQVTFPVSVYYSASGSPKNSVDKPCTNLLSTSIRPEYAPKLAQKKSWDTYSNEQTSSEKIVNT